MSFSPTIGTSVSATSACIVSVESSGAGCSRIPGGQDSSSGHMSSAGRASKYDKLLAVAQGSEGKSAAICALNPARPKRSQFISVTATSSTIGPSASTGTSSALPHWLTITSTSSFVTAAGSSSNREFSRMRLVPGVKIHIEFELIADLLFEDAQYIWSNAREQGDLAKFSGFVEAFKKHIAAAATVCTIMSDSKSCTTGDAGTDPKGWRARCSTSKPSEPLSKMKNAASPSKADSYSIPDVTPSERRIPSVSTLRSTSENVTNPGWCNVNFATTATAATSAGAVDSIMCPTNMSSIIEPPVVFPPRSETQFNARTPSSLPSVLANPKANAKGNLARLHSALKGVKASIRSASKAKPCTAPVNPTLSGQPHPLAPRGENGSRVVTQTTTPTHISSSLKTETKPPIPPKPEGSPWASRVRQGSRQQAINPRSTFKAGATAAETTRIKRTSGCSATLCGTPFPTRERGHELQHQRKVDRIMCQGADTDHASGPIPRCPAASQSGTEPTATSSHSVLQCMLPRIEAWVRRAAREYAANPRHFQTSLTLAITEDGAQGKGKAGATMTHLAVQEACDKELSMLYQSGHYRFPITFQDLVDLELGKVSDWMVEEVEAEKKGRADSRYL